MHLEIAAIKDVLLVIAIVIVIIMLTLGPYSVVCILNTANVAGSRPIGSDFSLQVLIKVLPVYEVNVLQVNVLTVLEKQPYC